VQVVGLEAGQLEVDGDAVVAVERLDGAHQLVLPGRVGRPAHRGEDVTEQRGGARKGQSVDGGREPVGGTLQVAACRRHPGPALLRRAVLGTGAPGSDVGGVGGIEVASRQVQVAEQCQDVGTVVG
jgi:hypothetical protein